MRVIPSDEMKTLSVKIPESLAEWLAGEARKSQRSRSDLVREALELKRRGGDGGGASGKPMSMAEAMADLRGSIRGPKDLSTNPEHLEGFGL